MTRYIYQDSVIDDAGNALESATVTVYLAGTATLATIYTAVSGGSADGDSAVTTDSTGTFSFFVDDTDYEDSQRFKIIISKSGYTPQTRDYLSIYPSILALTLTDAEIDQLEAIGSSTISAAQWGYLGALDQSLATTDAVTFATVNTGQGANKLYDMDQNVLTTSSPTFAAVSTGKVLSNSLSLKNAADDATYIACANGSTVTVYDNNVQCLITTNAGIRLGDAGATTSIDFGGSAGAFDTDDIRITAVRNTSGSDANIAKKPNLYLERTANGTDADLSLGWGNDNQEAIAVIHGKVGDASENGLTGFVSKVQSYQAENAATEGANTLVGGLIVAEDITLTGYTNRHIFGLGIQAVLTGSDGTLASGGQNVVCIEADVNIDQDLDGGTIGSPTYNATGFWAQSASSGNPTAAFRATHHTTGYWGYGLLLSTYFTKCGIYLKNGNTGVQGMYMETEYAGGFVAKFVNEGNNANRYGLEIQCGADDGTGATYYIQALDGNGTTVGYLQNVGGTFSVADASDKRIKSNIRKTKIKGLDIINTTPVKDFTKRGYRLTGLVAQDAQAVWPQSVSVGSNGLLNLIKDSYVIPLIKAVQELDAKVEKMKGKKNVKRKSVRSTGKRNVKDT